MSPSANPLKLFDIPVANTNQPAGNTNSNAANSNPVSANTAPQQTPVDVNALDINGDNAWIDDMLADKGLSKKTNINTEAEANFADYGAALDDWLKEAIINGGSGPNESEGIDAEEQAMYDKLAGIYQHSSVIKTNDFISYAAQMGYKIEGSYMETGYFVDNKSGSEYHRNNKNIKEGGHIYVMTITDPKTGADIVIADANGNASIEVEELFLNEILTGLSSQIDPSNFGKYTAVPSSGGSADLNGLKLSGDKALEYSSNLDKREGKEIKEEDEIKEEKEEKDKKATKEREEKVADKEAQKTKKEETITQREYNELEKEYAKEHLEELKEDASYQDLTEEELEEMAYKEAQEYMEKNYIVG